MKRNLKSDLKKEEKTLLYSGTSCTGLTEVISARIICEFPQFSDGSISDEKKTTKKFDPSQTGRGRGPP